MDSAHHLWTKESDWCQSSNDYYENSRWDFSSPFFTNLDVIKNDVFLTESAETNPAQNYDPQNYVILNGGTAASYDSFSSTLYGMYQPELPEPEAGLPFDIDQLKQDSVEASLKDIVVPPSPSRDIKMNLPETEPSPSKEPGKNEGKVHKVVKKNKKRKYLHQYDLKEVNDKELKCRIIKAKKCKLFRDSVREKLANIKPCQGCLEKLDGDRNLFKLLQTFLKRVQGNELELQANNL